MHFHLCLARQTNAEARATEVAFAHRDFSTVRGDYLLNNSKAQADPILTTEEERLKNARSFVQGNTGAAIGDLDEQLFIVVTRGHADMAALGQYLDCVHKEVEPHLRDSLDITLAEGAPGLQLMARRTSR